MAQKIFYYIVSSNEIKADYDAFVSLETSEFSFSDEKILIANMRKTIKKKENDTRSFEELFCAFANITIEMLTTLLLIKFNNSVIHNTIYLYYRSEKEINCMTFHLHRWCLSENSQYNITITDSIIDTLLNLIKNDITDTGVSTLQRKLAILTDFYYADNIHDENRIIEQFLLYWSSFNAFYRAFRIDYIMPIITSLHNNIDAANRPVIQWGDVTEVAIAQQVFEYDDCNSIYDLRNSIIHGNRIITFHCADNQSALKSMALYYSSIIKDIVIRNYFCCFEVIEQRDFKDTLCQICIEFLESKFRNKEFKDCTQEQKDEQIQNYHNRINENYHRMQAEWDD